MRRMALASASAEADPRARLAGASGDTPSTCATRAGSSGRCPTACLSLCSGPSATYVKVGLASKMPPSPMSLAHAVPSERLHA
jgi:hypothetical protein